MHQPILPRFFIMHLSNFWLHPLVAQSHALHKWNHEPWALPICGFHTWKRRIKNKYHKLPLWQLTLTKIFISTTHAWKCKVKTQSYNLHKKISTYVKETEYHASSITCFQNGWLWEAWHMKFYKLIWSKCMVPSQNAFHQLYRGLKVHTNPTQVQRQFLCSSRCITYVCMQCTSYVEDLEYVNTWVY